MTGAMVSLLAMGGTIATAPGTVGATPHHQAADLAARLSLSPAPVIRPVDVRTVSSRAVTPRDMWELAQAVQREITGGADGIVITHGTDTMEETAYALSLLLETPVPVVLTGAMRAPHLPGPDGNANLAAAISCALHRPLARYGPVVVFQDEIHTAGLVTKHHSTRPAAFASPSAGPVGSVIEGRVELLLGPPPGKARLTATAPPDKRVEIIQVAAGTDGSLLTALADRVDALVLAAVGAGHLPPPLAEAASELAPTLPLVLASRCADGPILRGTYSGPGSETQLIAAGLRPQHTTLAPLKARLRLIFGLSAGLTADQLFPSPTH
ncbi:asparaginase [Streptomyces werraensis]|uniref:asparaginase n=1 Tax=Streptomyces werraensis TaxID=68284 RepID=UPI00381B6697